MTCDECGYQQTQGRFCGRCGAHLMAEHRPTASSTGLEPPSSRTVPDRARLWVAAVAAGVLAVVAWLALDAVSPPTRDDAGLAPPSPTVVSPSAASSSAPPPTLTAPVVEGSPIDFGEATGVTLLFDDGLDGGLAVDLDTGRQRRLTLPGQRAGDQPFRLWRMGGWVVVGWGDVWAVDAGAQHPSRRLGRARLFVPAADPDQLWLIEATQPGSESPTWTLIDSGGQVVADVDPPGPRLEPIRGVPGGLAVRDLGGEVLVYDLDQGTLVHPVGGPDWIADATHTRVAWCQEPCQRLHVADADGAEVAALSGAGETFRPDGVWLSPDGRWLAAALTVQAGAGTDFRLRIYDLEQAQAVADMQLALGGVYGAWTADGDQFFAWNHFASTPGAPARLSRWSTTSSDLVTLDVGDEGINDVHGFVTLPAQGAG